MPTTVTAPGPRGLPLFGSLFELKKDPIGALERAAAEHGDVVLFRVGPFRLYLLNHPDAIQHVLQDRWMDYPKSLNYRELEPLVGKGLLTNEGVAWRDQRRLLQPAFQPRAVARFQATFDSVAAEVAASWTRFATSGEPIDVAREMGQLALSIAGRTLFSIDLAREALEIRAALDLLLRFVERRTASVLRPPLALPLPSHLRVRRSVRLFDELVARLIAERRRRGVSGDDLLGTLLDTRDGDRPLTDAQIRDEVVTFLVAGHETTANALAWTFYLLALNPEVDARTGEEGMCGLVFQEALRLYPPAWWIERQAATDDEVLGFHVPRGAFMVVSPYTIQRHPRYWPEPLRFDPERFRPERSAGRPRCAYVPFGAGPRLCIGQSFALLEGERVLSALTKRFRLELVPGTSVVPESQITLRPRGGISMVVKARA